MKNPERSVKATAVGKAFGGFTDQERAATKELVQEDNADGKSAVLAKIAATPPVGFQSCVGSQGGHARTATTTRGYSVVHLFQRAGTAAIVAVLIAIGILWTAAVLVYLGGLVLRLGGLVT